MNDPDILYHYTTQQGLIGIIENKEIWMTNLHYLNDSTEFYYSLGIFKDCFKSLISTVALQNADPTNNIEMDRKIKEMSCLLGVSLEKKSFRTFMDEMTEKLFSNDVFRKMRIYICAFSEDGDCLGQWKGYCNNGIGFSLGFSKSDLFCIAKKQECVLNECIYDQSYQKRLALEAVDDYVKTIIASNNDMMKGDAAFKFLSKLMEIAPTMKHPSFIQEKEWRLISQTNKTPEAFRPSISMIVPYMKFSFKEELPLKRIIVGPTPHSLLSVQSVRSLLRSKEIKSVKVVSSTVPYRAW